MPMVMDGCLVRHLRCNCSCMCLPPACDSRVVKTILRFQATYTYFTKWKATRHAKLRPMPTQKECCLPARPSAHLSACPPARHLPPARLENLILVLGMWDPRKLKVSKSKSVLPKILARSRLVRKHILTLSGHFRYFSMGRYAKNVGELFIFLGVQWLLLTTWGAVMDMYHSHALQGKMRRCCMLHATYRVKKSACFPWPGKRSCMYVKLPWASTMAFWFPFTDATKCCPERRACNLMTEYVSELATWVLLDLQ